MAGQECILPPHPHYSRVVFAISLAALLTSSAPAHGAEGKQKYSPQGIASNDHYRPFLINHIFNYYGNNGDGSCNPFSWGEGFEFPKGAAKHLFFEDGFLWGGFHKGRPIPKVGGSTYPKGLQAGRILNEGTLVTDPVADDPTLQQYHIYRTRPEVSPSAIFDSDTEARMNAEEVAFTSRYQQVTAQQVFTEYQQDWIEWPAKEGAPFIDKNGNSVYDPAIDIPGIPGADQTLWYVSNDLDSARVLKLAGSPPIGLEVQRTIWGYRDRGLLDNVVFVQTRLINKSGAPIDSMFVSQWSDPDVGEGGDDRVGCDTTRDLGYAYNGRDLDQSYGQRIPSVGFALLHGPQIASPGSSALAGLRMKSNSRNVRMSAFEYFLDGYALYVDANQGPGGDSAWYRLMNGCPARNGEWFVDPTTGGSTKCVLTGDPITGTGWVDANPGDLKDRRMVLSSGPFTMAQGDTQDVVLAFMVGDGPDRISSIRSLRYVADLAHILARNLFLVLPPKPILHVTFASAANAIVNIIADNAPNTALSIVAELIRGDGSSAGRLDLYDDGVHGDRQAGDGVWGNTITLACERDPVALSLSVTDSSGRTIFWKRLVEPVSIVGPIVTQLLPLFSDHINGDGRANPGENIRFGVEVTNGTAFGLSKVSVYLDSMLWPDIEPLDAIASGASTAMKYSPGNLRTYFTTSVSSTQSSGQVVLGVTMLDDRGNRWRDTVRIPVFPFAVPATSLLLKRTNGLSYGDFGIRIVDPAQVKNHMYLIRGIDFCSSGGPGFSLTDSTDGTILLANHAFPDSLGHDIPVTDGFKVLQGTVDIFQASAGWSVPHGAQAWSSANATPPLTFDCFDGTIGVAKQSFFSRSTIGNSQFHSVLIRFAACNGMWDPKAPPADSNFSRGYRYLRSATVAPAMPDFAPWIVNKAAGYAYQDYNYGVPFSAWDVDVSPPRRLSVGHLENNVTAGRVDGRYWPPSASENLDNGWSCREWFFVFATPYSEIPEPTLQKDILNNMLPLIWVGTPTRAMASGFSGDEEFLILARHALASGDEWTFNPVSFLGVSQDSKPVDFKLEQNFPNPFNPTTVVSYQLPVASHVRLVVYDLLGRQVAVLVNARKGPGSHEVRFLSTGIASGVYFCRMQAGDFTETRKMVLMR